MTPRTNTKIHPAIHSAVHYGWPLIKLSNPQGGGNSPGKAPVTRNWPTAPGLTPEQANDWLNNAQGNIGIVCGERANRLLVLDYDGEVPADMPPTIRVATGGGGYHDYYVVPEGIDLKKANRVKFPYRGCLVDARWTGGQVCYPPSIHAETGAEYEFVEGRDPASISIAEAPADAIDAILAAQTAPKPTPKPAQAPTQEHSDAYINGAITRAIANIVNAPEGQRNDTLNREAYSLAGLPGIDHADLIQRLSQAAEQINLPAAEYRNTLRSAITSGAAAPRQIPERTHIPTATPPSDLQPELCVISPAPRHLADKYLETVHPRGTLRYWRGDWYEYDGARYTPIPETLLRAKLSATLKTWHFVNDRDDTKFVISCLKESLLRDVIGQLRQPGRTIVPDNIEAPIWLRQSGDLPAPEFVAMKNGLLHLPTRTLHKHDPAYFTTTALPFAYDENAPGPETWIDFLARTWPGDDGVDCALLLAEWFGYCISRDMSHHKMLWIIGPSRGGKGLMSRILSALIGEENVCTPTLGNLGDRYGGQVLINARLAIIGDARMGKRTDDAAITERLLSLSGGDKQTFPRKYLADWTGWPSAKFLLLSNELPGLTDSSGALTGRLLMLQTTQSYLGREDHTLERRIREEIPGIFNWALGGLDRLAAQKRFTVPAASAEILHEQRRLASPITAFVEDKCIIAENATCTRDGLYSAYVAWVEDGNQSRPSNKSWFGRALKAAFPGVRDAKINQTRCYIGISICDAVPEWVSR